jgi:hypothetical protein
VSQAHELELAAADDLGRVEQQRDALFDVVRLQDSKARRAAVMASFGVLRGAGLLVDADDLRRARRIDGANITNSV